MDDIECKRSVRGRDVEESPRTQGELQVAVGSHECNGGITCHGTKAIRQGTSLTGTPWTWLYSSKLAQLLVADGCSALKLHSASFRPNSSNFKLQTFL